MLVKQMLGQCLQGYRPAEKPGLDGIGLSDGVGTGETGWTTGEEVGGEDGGLAGSHSGSGVDLGEDAGGGVDVGSESDGGSDEDLCGLEKTKEAT